MKKLLILIFVSLVLSFPAYSAQAGFLDPGDTPANNTPPQPINQPPISACIDNTIQDPKDPNFCVRCPANTVPNASHTACVDRNGQPVNTPANKPANTPGSSTGGSIDCGAGYTSQNGLCIPPNPFANTPGLAGTGSITELAAKIIQILLYFAGIVAVIFVIIGGYKYMTAGGSEESATKGRKTMTQAIIGLVIVILSYVIITAVTNFLIK